MGKDYFEFLEEEFQAFASQLQKALSTSSVTTTGDSTYTNGNAKRLLDTQFTRCRAILQQLYTEAAKNTAFQNRWELYKIQLQTLQEHYDESKDNSRQEITYMLS